MLNLEQFHLSWIWISPNTEIAYFRKFWLQTQAVHYAGICATSQSWLTRIDWSVWNWYTKMVTQCPHQSSNQPQRSWPQHSSSLWARSECHADVATACFHVNRYRCISCCHPLMVTQYWGWYIAGYDWLGVWMSNAHGWLARKLAQMFHGIPWGLYVLPLIASCLHAQSKSLATISA